MRLRKYQILLAQSLIVLASREYSTDAYNTTFVKGKTLVDVLNSIRELNLFEEEIKTIRGTNLFAELTEDRKLSNNEASRVNQNLDRIVSKGTIILSFLNMILNEKNYSFSIKLPENIKDFDSLESISNSLKKALSIPVHTLGGNIKFVNFDLGSLWIDLIADSNQIIEFVKNLVEAGIAVYGTKLLSNKMTQYFHSLPDSDDDFKRKYAELNEKKLINEINNQTKLVIEATKISNTKVTNIDGSVEEKSEETKTILNVDKLENEGEEVIKIAIKELSNVFAQGLDITPPVSIQYNSEDKKKYDFPDTTKIDYNDLKELSEKTSTEEKDDNK